MKQNKLSVLIVVCMAILCISFIRFSGAWFNDSDSASDTITMANGIQLEATGLKVNGNDLTGVLESQQTYQLVFTNNTAVAPSAQVGVKNVTLKTKANVNSGNSCIRFKITYEYSTNGATWTAGTYSNCKLMNEISVNSATASKAGFVKQGDWYYYFKHSASKTYSNLAVLNGTAVSLFSGDQTLTISDELEPGSQIRITLTIDAVQSENDAVEEEWAGQL